MELAIPLLALGGFYIISNQEKEKEKKESYKNLGSKQVLYQNYPVNNVNSMEDSPNSYQNPNAATDKYFNQNLYENLERKGEKVGNNPKNVYSLSGNYLETNQFKHNNMVPFYGGKPKGYTYDSKMSETILDNMVGASSQTIKKIEQGPLFKPEENVSWTYNSPNNSDFYQSRMNPSMKNNNVKPFDTIRVGPGLDQGYTVNGSNGFNSGMEARDKWLPLTVDELRVSTNPKMTYELSGHEGPGQTLVKNVGLEGRVEKNRPDNFYINTQDRYFTTTGVEKGETLRPIQETGNVRRNVDIDYCGVPGAQYRQAPTAPNNYEKSRKKELDNGDVSISTAIGKGDISDERRIRSYSKKKNHRTTTNQPDNLRSGFSKAVGAVIAPLMYYLKPTRKEEMLENIRTYGQTKTNVPNTYVINPNDKTKTTNKETTIYAPTFYINSQNNQT
jgi:hypothetical protein